MPENELAWQLYQDGRLPGTIGNVLFQLETASLSPNDAAVVAMKIRVLAHELNELEEERNREERERLKNANR